jgi:copper chaperone CopZ
LSPWLGPDADNEAIQLGLTTLRTWWQHRRKGESGSAIAALGTEKMKGVVEGYTRHFFTLAHCVVINDKVQPPRGLHSKMKELEKLRARRSKASRPASANDMDSSLSTITTAIHADLTDPNLTPLEKLHVAQRRQMESNGGLNSSLTNSMISINMTNKCVPGKIDLPGVVDAVNRHATQFVHRGTVPSEVGSGDNMMMDAQQQASQSTYGDPNTTPVVFVSSNGDIQIAMKVEGITCAHCVKIVETVLRGCNGIKSPIKGLLDAAADGDLSSVLLKIDEAANAKRVAFEASRNLCMVGYTAEPIAMSIVGSGADPITHSDLGALATAFEVVATTEAKDVFDWTIPCTCPDNGVLRGDCARYVLPSCAFCARLRFTV